MNNNKTEEQDQGIGLGKGMINMNNFGTKKQEH